MVPVNDLRSGATFIQGKDIFAVLSYEHVKMGRGNATIRLKIRNLRSGAIVEKSFISGSSVDPINLDKADAQYLYRSGSAYVFMDMVTFEQFEIPQRIVGEYGGFLTEGLAVKVLSYESEPLSLELPLKMEFIIKDTPPGVKGNSATNIWKDAVLETGKRVKVPLFVDTGDRIRVDTRTGEYVERAGK